MQGNSWPRIACAGALLLAACAAKQEKPEEPVGSPAAEAASEPFSPSGEMEVGMSFDEGEEPEAEEPEAHEPPPTQTYSPANKLTPEEKAAAEGK